MLAPIHLFALLLLHHCSRQTPSKVASAPTELPRAARVCSLGRILELASGTAELPGAAHNLTIQKKLLLVTLIKFSASAGKDQVYFLVAGSKDATLILMIIMLIEEQR